MKSHKGKLPYAVAAATQVRPDLRPPFARWRFGVRAGVSSGLLFAVLQILYFVTHHWHWPSDSSSPLLELVSADFIMLPLLLGVYGLLLPLMRTIRAAVTLGACLGAVVTSVWLVSDSGLAALREGAFYLIGGLLAFFFVLMTLMVREAALVRWRPPA